MLFSLFLLNSLHSLLSGIVFDTYGYGGSPSFVPGIVFNTRGYRGGVSYRLAENKICEAIVYLLKITPKLMCM